jgi:hypothetical protein
VRQLLSNTSCWYLHAIPPPLFSLSFYYPLSPLSFSSVLLSTIQYLRFPILRYFFPLSNISAFLFFSPSFRYPLSPLFFLQICILSIISAFLFFSTSFRYSLSPLFFLQICILSIISAFLFFSPSFHYPSGHLAVKMPPEGFHHTL